MNAHDVSLKETSGRCFGPLRLFGVSQGDESDLMVLAGR